MDACSGTNRAPPSKRPDNRSHSIRLPWRRKWARFLLLALLNSLAVSQQSTAESEAFIKVTGFSVPQSARVGDKVRLVCNYSLIQGQVLHAMKLFKDDSEVSLGASGLMYRITPVDGGPEYQKQEFYVEGIQLDMASSNRNEIVMRILNKLSSGSYKCQVIVEDSFKSTSVVKRMEVREQRAGGQQEVVAMGIVGNGNYQANPQLAGSRQQQQRHAANRKFQQQTKQANQYSSTQAGQAVQRGHSAASSSSSAASSAFPPAPRPSQPQQLCLAAGLLLLGLLLTIIR